MEDSITYATNVIWPRLEKNGVLIFDDYLSSGFKGAKESINSFVEKNENEILVHELKDKMYYIIKK